ncbi:HypC/HybG/HupF family hydrogenase formation chaperone [Candidatus Woesearchaeota archaeon]|nr:HypC/HybG/HupF family hydrogenase formation chaperone [Candidatus Woesearchaeota archaeon]MBW3014063.1 HypC/HybG/HupF family hydrogenase formation chaperone [Candidatus Woesearchaeota archaeon]
MCLAIPGKIIKISGDDATIEYPGENRVAKIVDGDFKVGDYVFVSAQIVVQKLTEEEALASLEQWKNLT